MPKFETLTVKIDEHSDRPVELLPDVLRQLNAMVRLLTDIAARSSKVEVVRIVKGSPLTAKLRVVNFDEPEDGANNQKHKPKARRTTMPFRRLEKVFDAVNSVGHPRHVDAAGMIAVQDFAKMLKTATATIQTAHREMKVDATIIAQIDAKIGKVIKSRGTMTGILEGLNVHSKPWSFIIYPKIGPTRIKCEFDESLFQDVQAAIRKVVTVEGLKEFIPTADWPLKMRAEAVEIKQESPPGAWLSLVESLNDAWVVTDDDEKSIVLEGFG